MKKGVISLTIVSWILTAAGILCFLFMGTLLGLNYTYQSVFATVTANFATVFDFSNVSLSNIVLYVGAGLLIILFLIQLVMLIVNRHPKAIPVMLSWIILAAAATLFAYVLFIDGFLPDVSGTTSGGEAVTVHYVNGLLFPFGLFTAGLLQMWQMIVIYALLVVVAVGFVLILIAEIMDLVLIAQQPGTPRRDYAKDLESDDKVVVVKDDNVPVAPSSDEIRGILRSELDSKPAEQAAPSSSPSSVSEPCQAPSFPPMAPAQSSPIVGPLLVQYINTYAPEASKTVKEEPKKEQTVPVSEIQAAMEGRQKPLSADDIRKIIKEELDADKKVRDEENKAKLEAEQKQKEADQKQQEADRLAKEAAEKAEKEKITKEDIKSIIHDELNELLAPEEEEEKAPVTVELVPEKEEPKPAVIPEKPVEPEQPKVDIREVIKDELAAYRAADLAEKKKEEELRKQVEKETQEKILAEQKKQADEAAAKKAQEEAIAKAREEGKASQAPSLSSEDIRKIIAEELSKQAPKEVEPAEKPLSKEDIRLVIAEELKKSEPAKAEPAPVKQEAAPKIVVVTAPAPVATPAPAPAIEPESPAKRVVGAINPNLPPHEKIIRIPFPTRMLSAEKELKDNYNELKSELMSYGVKSRVSNSGDTFRLHKVTFCKITIAGKGLKLYFALNPKDYASSTLPVQDAGHKGVYKDIPLVFKVKSELSLRRAKQLISDAMDKGNLEQSKVEVHDWASELKDYKPQGSDEDD